MRHRFSSLVVSCAIVLGGAGAVGPRHVVTARRSSLERNGFLSGPWRRLSVKRLVKKLYFCQWHRRNRGQKHAAGRGRVSRRHLS